MSDLSAYPVLFFLHTALAAPPFLQDLLSSPFPLKLCKAWLYGYVGGTNSRVILSCENFGEWEAEPKVIGVVFKVTCQREEDILKQYAGAGVEVEDVQFELRTGSALFGVKDWAHGKAFVRKDVREVVDKNPASVSNFEKEECDIFEALRTEHDSPATPKKDPANAEHNDFAASVHAGLRTSCQKQDPKATLSQQWVSRLLDRAPAARPPSSS